jgi:hypothetical protein
MVLGKRYPWNCPDHFIWRKVRGHQMNLLIQETGEAHFDSASARVGLSKVIRDRLLMLIREDCLSC